MKKIILPLLVIVLGTAGLMLFDQYVQFSWSPTVYSFLLTLVMFLLGTSLAGSGSSSTVKKVIVVAVYAVVALYFIGVLKISAIDEVLSKIQFTNSTGYSDASYYYSQVEVTEEPQDLTTPLERNVSLCRFILTDDYPDDVVKMRFQYKGGSGAFDAKTGFGSVSSTQTVFFDVTEGQKQFDLYTFLHDTEGALKLLVTAYDDGDNVVHEREFDVPMIQKQITWFSGAYFTGSGLGNTDITIVINTDWEGETHLTF